MTAKKLDMTTRLRSLASLLEPFESSDFEFGHWVQPEPEGEVLVMGNYVFSPTAERFLRACETGGWVSPAFDWPTWSETDECRRLMSDPLALNSATPEDLEHILTTLIREERYGDGGLAGAFESGLLVGILRRASVLANEVPS